MLDRYGAAVNGPDIFLMLFGDLPQVSDPGKSGQLFRDGIIACVLKVLS